MFSRLLVFLVALMGFSFSSVSAQEPELSEPVIEKEVAEAVLGLEQKQMFHFMAIYANYNMVSAVKAVQDDVSVAIEKCGDNNPGMKRDLDARFSKWQENIAPLLEEAKGNVDNMVLAQNYMPQSKFDSLFVKVDKTRAVNSSNFEKTPVTSPEACEFMLSKMDETEQSMQQILQATLQSYPDALKKMQR